MENKNQIGSNFEKTNKADKLLSYLIKETENERERIQIPFRIRKEINNCWRKQKYIYKPIPEKASR